MNKNLTIERTIRLSDGSRARIECTLQDLEYVFNVYVCGKGKRTFTPVGDDLKNNYGYRGLSLEDRRGVRHKASVAAVGQHELDATAQALHDSIAPGKLAQGARFYD